MIGTRTTLSTTIAPLVLLAVVALGGCASAARRSQDYLAGDELQALVAREAATDARFEPVREHPWMMVDLALRYRAEAYPQAADAATRREFVDDFVQRAERVGHYAMLRSLERIEPPALAEFASAHRLEGRDAVRAVLAAYDQRSAAALAAERARLALLADAAAVDRHWQALVDGIEPSIMTRGRLTRRLLSAPAVPFIEAWIAYHNHSDYRGPVTPRFAASTRFVPRIVRPADSELSAGDWEVLARYAPVVVQEQAAQPDYPARFDRFGTVRLEGTTLADATPAVDTAAPALYAFMERHSIQGRATRQLVYTLWYPEHPAASSFDPEAGLLDGWTVRISLDQHDRPLLLESVSNCGCYYKIFPSETLESMSAAAWPQKLPGKSLHLEQHLAHDFDAVVPETVAGLANPRRRVALYFSAGHHQLLAVRALEASALAADSADSYTLHAYDELERLPFGARRASLFAEDGLVRHAHRRECSLLTPSGLYHAGHPRQRETQMIYFDEAAFDDPGLLERYLRLPPDAFGDQV